jgi:hypothetical protein
VQTLGIRLAMDEDDARPRAEHASHRPQRGSQLTGCADVVQHLRKYQDVHVTGVLAEDRIDKVEVRYRNFDVGV